MEIETTEDTHTFEPEPIKESNGLYHSIFLVALTAMLLFYKLGEPYSQTFDEAYYIPFAQKYINGIYHLQSHPPLGKMLIALGEVLYEDETRTDFMDVEGIEEDWPEDWDIRGFRIMPALFGTLVPLLTYLTMRRILAREQEWLAFGVALALALDTAFLSVSRIAMLDVFLLFFIMLCFFLGVVLIQQEKIGRQYYVLVGLMGFSAACAANVKDTGLIVGLMYLFVLIDHWRREHWEGIGRWQHIRQHIWRQMLPNTLTFGIVFLVTYLGLWFIHFAITPTPNTYRDYNISELQKQYIAGEVELGGVQRYSLQIYDGIVYHFNDLTDLPPMNYSDSSEGIESPWYWWPFGGRAMNYRSESSENITRYATFVSNPATWVFSLVGVMMASATVASDVVFKFLKEKEGRWWLYALTALYWGYMFPFFFVLRATYIHYYLPPLIIGLMMLGIFVQVVFTLELRVLRWLVIAVGVLAFIGFVVYKPFVYFEPMTSEQFEWRNFWEPWNMSCIGCND